MTRSPMLIRPATVSMPASSITAPTPTAMIAAWPRCRADSVRWLPTLPSTHCASTLP